MVSMFFIIIILNRERRTDLTNQLHAHGHNERNNSVVTIGSSDDAPFPEY